MLIIDINADPFFCRILNPPKENIAKKLKKLKLCLMELNDIIKVVIEQRSASIRGWLSDLNNFRNREKHYYGIEYLFYCCLHRENQLFALQLITGATKRLDKTD